MTKPFLLRSQLKLLTNRYSPLHRCMQKDKEGSVGPDEFALADALKTSAALRSLNHGNQIHAIIVKSGFCRFTVLMTALMDLNLKCSSLPDARRLFDEMSDRDVVSWTSMIVGYVQHQHYDESLGLFKSMVESDTNPNGYSFSGALSACSRLQALRQGKQIHAQVVVLGLLVLESILQNSLLNMYVKCQSLYCAQMLFDSMSVKGIIAWNEMMSGYMQCGQGEEALELLALMVSTGTKPDDFSYAICTNACAALASLSQGSQIHACIVRNGYQSDLVIGNALVDMYAKCGCVDSAKLVFNLMPFKDAVLWTAAISAFGRCGHVEEAIVMFEQMRKLRVKLDKITYLAMLSACSHGGLVDSGWHYFRSMTEGDLIPAEPEHYACMVDILCRRGCLAQALEFIKRMPLKPNIRIWSSFLNSSKMLGDVRLAEFAAAKLLELDPENHSNYVVLSNMYAAGNDWKETLTIREKMKSAHTKKEPGCSWVEVKNGIHVFLTADPSHPEMGEILWTLNRLNTCLKDEEHYKCCSSQKRYTMQFRSICPIGHLARRSRWLMRWAPP